MQQLVEFLRGIGFTDADQEKDFGYVISYVTYLKRIENGRHQYFSVVHSHSDGRVLEETCFEEYLAEKNTRKPKGEPKKENLKPGEFSDYQKRGFAPVRLELLRSFQKIKDTL